MILFGLVILSCIDISEIHVITDLTAIYAAYILRVQEVR
jgi:hypothetical protein